MKFFRYNQGSAFLGAALIVTFAIRLEMLLPVGATLSRSPSSALLQQRSAQRALVLSHGQWSLVYFDNDRECLAAKRIVVPQSNIGNESSHPEQLVHRKIPYGDD